MADSILIFRNFSLFCRSQIFSELTLELVASLRDRSGAEDCLFQPQGVCVDSTRRMLYVCDCNKRVTVYRYGSDRGGSEFAFVAEFGSEGSGPGQVRRAALCLELLFPCHSRFVFACVLCRCLSFVLLFVPQFADTTGVCVDVQAGEVIVGDLIEHQFSVFRAF
jgi:hypothetical protein